MGISRRRFVSAASIGVAATGLATRTARAQAASPALPSTTDRPLVISTWGFGKPANEAALKVFASGGSALDAVEQGIWVPESDRGNPSVGLGGMPNGAGVVQQDASIMFGPGHRAGSVAAIEGVVHPISVARRVMGKTPHVMLVGDGARMFAIEQGLETVENDTQARYEAWRAKRAAAKATSNTGGASNPAKNPKNHDTIALLVLAADGTLAGGCSTSGWGGKLPGRVGDSPIIGGGLYVDNDVGAAGATGLGENILRYCGSFLVVELMRQGLHPQEACLEAIRRIARKDPKGMEISVSLVAIDKKGRFGAGSSAKGFQFAVATASSSRVETAPAISNIDIGPEGGNRR